MGSKTWLNLGDEILDYREAIFLLVSSGCSPDVVYHAIQVSWMVEFICEKLKRKGHEINRDLAIIGGLLHDLGRSDSHGLDHGIVGAKILRNKGEELLAAIVETHIGGGITREEALSANLPAKDYIPVTIEQKIVCYADKLFQYQHDGNYRIDSFTVEKDASIEVDKLKMKLGEEHESHVRLLKIEEMLTDLAGELPGEGFEAGNHFKP